MKLYIQNVERKTTKNGKAYYVVNGGEYSSWDPVPQGKTIEADIETQPSKDKYGNSQVYKNIKGFHVVEDASQQIAPPVDRWYMPFVSNMCAHLIQVGAIKEPADMNKWARHAKTVAFFLDGDGADRAPADGDDLIPF